MAAVSGIPMPQGNRNNDPADKVVLDQDVYCSLVKCAFNKAFDTHGGTGDQSILFRQLVNSLIKNPSEAVIHQTPEPKTGDLNGTLKKSLEAIKADFLGHYSLLYNLEEYSIKERLDILGRHSPIEETVAHESSGSTKFLKGPNQSPEPTADSNKHEEENPFARNGLFSMIRALQNKLERLNNRIEAMDKDLQAELGDPNLREWELSKESLHMRGYNDMEGDEELCTHIRSLYSHLRHKTQLNEQKIEAMRNRLMTLQSHAKIISRRQSNDTRIAF